VPDLALAVRDVVVRFGGLMALDGVSAAVEQSTIHGIIGPNGAGKTTLLNVVSGFARPTRGSVEVLGVPATGSPPHVVCALGVARTYQNIRLFPGLGVAETVIAGRHRLRTAGAVRAVLATPRSRADRRATRAYAARLLHRVGVDADPDARADELPYVDQRRLEIARALATEPKVLLLDEPTAGMNAAEAAALGSLLVDLRAGGLTQVLIEHNVGIVTAVCDSVSVLDRGRVIAEGSADDCLADAGVRTAYFGRER
jgi:branched-chain amino acid transport system ATP-binding protein